MPKCYLFSNYYVLIKVHLWQYEVLKIQIFSQISLFLAYFSNKPNIVEKHGQICERKIFTDTNEEGQFLLQSAGT